VAAQGTGLVSDETRLISTATMFLAVVLPSIALFVLDNKNLARLLFVAVLVIGYGLVFVRWRTRR
jgi:hypothetical protein